MCHTPYFLTKYDTPFVSPQTAVKKDNYVDGIAQTTTHNGDSSTVGVGHVTLTRQLVHCSLLEVFRVIHVIRFNFMSTINSLRISSIAPFKPAQEIVSSPEPSIKRVTSASC